MNSALVNANPIVYPKKERRVRIERSSYTDEYSVEPIDELEIFDILNFLFPNTHKKIKHTLDFFFRTN